MRCFVADKNKSPYLCGVNIENRRIMATSIVIIFMCLVLVLAAVVVWYTYSTKDFHKEMKSHLMQSDLDNEHNYRNLRDQYIRLNTLCVGLLRQVNNLRNDVDELIATREKERQAKQTAFDKLKGMLQNASEQHIDTEVVVVDLDKLSNGKDITNKPVNTSKVSVPGKVKKSKRTTVQPPRNHPTSTVEATVRNRTNFAELREKGLSVREAGEQVGVSLTTAKRYEKWRNEYSK